MDTDIRHTEAAGQLSPNSPEPPPTLAEVMRQRLPALAQQLAETAVERDRQGGHPAAQRELIRASGLLALTIPHRLGGLGGSVRDLFETVRQLARVDSALAHVLGFHHLQLLGFELYTGPAANAHGARHLRDSAEQRLFWGNALNPADTRLQAQRVSEGWRLSGSKSFCSGALGSDRLTWSAITAEGQTLIGIVPTARQGITVAGDWDAFGQKQTDSGSVHFEHVFVHDDELLQTQDQPSTPRTTLRAQVAQLLMSNLYLGIAEGAFQQARLYTGTHSKPWAAAGVARAVDDPFVQQRFGDLWMHVRAAQAITDAAARVLAGALAQGPALTAQQRGDVAVAGAEAKVLSHRAAIQVSSQFFELTGARSTSARLGFDRFWRNARVHTLHDPVDYKLRDIGRFQLEGRIPDATPYS
jgi:alkylation response protein AidB-like acyl-CoA dehydrogenase